MKNIINNFLQPKALFVTVFLMLFYLSCSSPKLLPRKEFNNQIENYKKQINDLYNQISDLNYQIYDLNNQIDYLNYEIKNLSLLSENVIVDSPSNSMNYQIQLKDSIIENNYMQIERLSEQMALIQNNNSNHIIIRDTIVKENEKFIIPESNLKSVAFTCPSEMKEENTYVVQAMLSYFLDKETIKTELLSSINVTRKEMNQDLLSLSDIETKDVLLSNYMKIELVDPAGKFIIDSTNINNPVKIFDDNLNKYYSQSFKWIWEVTPKPNTKGSATLYLAITPYDKNMKAQNGERRSYPINITFKQSFVSTMWERANRNPEWALASIITPFLTFIVGLYYKKKKDNNENKEA